MIHTGKSAQHLSDQYSAKRQGDLFCRVERLSAGQLYTYHVRYEKYYGASNRDRIDHGIIGSVDDKVLSFFPEYSVKRGEKTIYDVTIKHLLTMRTPYKGKGDPWTKVCTSDDWTTASLDFPGGRKGITDEFDYRTVCLHILSGILYKATGMKTVDFANQYLFSPLGIAEHRNYYSRTAEEHKEFTISKSPKENIWFADPDGLGTPGYGLCMSASDMVKIGQLCLNNGLWEGKRIISEGWIDEMTLEELWEFFPIFLVAHDDQWKDCYRR